MNAPVTVVGGTADESGAWGMAVLAAYMKNGGGKTLEDYLDGIFANQKGETVCPDPADVAGFGAFMKNYIAALPVVRTAVTAYSYLRPK